MQPKFVKLNADVAQSVYNLKLYLSFEMYPADNTIRASLVEREKNNRLLFCLHSHTLEEKAR